MLLTFLFKYWTKKMKTEKYQELLQEVEYFLADQYRKSFHRVFFEDVKQAFPEVKEKHLKKMWKELK